MTQRRERFEIDIDATPGEVWDRLTTAEGLESWFGARASIDFRIAGERIVGWGDQAEIVGEIREIEPERLLRIVYLADGDEVGAEEWIIASEGSTTRLTLINSMSGDINDWEGFYGDIRRGWNLFLTSLRFGLEDALTPNREVECAYFPAKKSREETWEMVGFALDASPLVKGLEPALLDPPHSRLLVAEDRSFLLDIEGSGPGQVLYAQAATHHGPAEWRQQALDLARAALEPFPAR